MYTAPPFTKTFNIMELKFEKTLLKEEWESFKPHLDTLTADGWKPFTRWYTDTTDGKEKVIVIGTYNTDSIEPLEILELQGVKAFDIDAEKNTYLGLQAEFNANDTESMANYFQKKVLADFVEKIVDDKLAIFSVSQTGRRVDVGVDLKLVKP